MALDKSKPLTAIFTDKDPSRGTWKMAFKDWADFNAYVGQKAAIIQTYHIES